MNVKVTGQNLPPQSVKIASSDSILKIGFDGKRAAGNLTGLGNYSRYILEILATYYPNNNYLVYSPKHFKKNILVKIREFPAVLIRYPKINQLKSLWRSYTIAKDLQTDQVKIFHGLSNEIPFDLSRKGILTVVTIHDLIFLQFPKFYPVLDRIIYKFKFKYACKNADKIIAVSERTKKDIMQFFHIPENRIQVINQNCSPVFSQEMTGIKLQSIWRKYNLPEKYLLNVGTIETRKNLLLIIKTLKNLDPDIHLIVIGKETGYSLKIKKYIADHHLADRVRFLKNVPQNDLPAIYRQAKIFIFPSRYEGFGIPIVEALQSGVPVIAASGSCLEEAGGPGSIYIHPDDDLALTESIKLLLTNHAIREKMILEGLEFIKRFSDNAIADQIIELYQNLKKEDA
ncbi:MAG: glycosyltransferase family 4 protein [Flavobacterium sp.]|nr:glycosyltransferase family 4 protein [Pedobacter sp.]